MATKIFISHSSKDKEVANEFNDYILQLGLGFKPEEIFCTSSEGMNIKTGEDWRKAIKDNFDEASVIILMLTPNYKQSEICLNEMGAAWLSDKEIIPLTLGFSTHTSIGVCIEHLQNAKLDSENTLSGLYDILIKKFNMDCPEQILWNSRVRRFLNFLENYLGKTKFSIALSQKEIEEKLEEMSGLEKAFDELESKCEKLEEQIKKLKACKDKEEVRQVEKEYKEDIDNIEKFNNCLNEAADALKKVSKCVQTVIYNTLYNSNFEISYLMYRYDIDNAVNKKYIEYNEADKNYKALWNKAIMSDIKDKLCSLKSAIEALSPEEYDDICREYSYPDEIELSDIDFWDNFLRIKLING